jgi:hypothetical protein
MASPEQVYNELIELLRISMLLPGGQSSACTAMLEGDVKALEEKLYSQYSRARGLSVISNLRAQLEAEERAYAGESQKARQTVAAFAARYPRFIKADIGTSILAMWVWVFVNPEHAGRTTNRLYLNIKTPKFNEFLARFLGTLLTDAWMCGDCGEKAVRYDAARGARQFECRVCGGPASFKFKFSNAGLRYDKIVMYFASPAAAQAMAIDLGKKFRPYSYFEPKTQFFTAEYFPGLGYATEPESGEAEAVAGKGEKISFGELILNALARIVIRAVAANKAKALAIYQAWLKTNKTAAEQQKNAQQLFDALNREIFPAMRGLIAADPVLQGYFAKLAGTYSGAV